MKKYLLIALFSFPAWANELVIGVETGNNNPGFGDGRNALYLNDSGQPDISLLSGEDETNSVQKVEQQFSYCLDDADIVCKATPGFLHTVSCWGEDAAATAGRVQIRDSATATGGTVVWQQEFAAAIATPMTWVADIVMPAGIAIDWDTTADVFCTVSYR